MPSHSEPTGPSRRGRTRNEVSGKTRARLRLRGRMPVIAVAVGLLQYRPLRHGRWRLHERKESGVLEGGCSVPGSCHVVGVGREVEEVLDAGLVDEHDEVPALVFGSDEVVAAVADELDRPSGGVEKRQGVTYVAVVGISAGDRGGWRKLGKLGVVGPLAKAQEVEHR